MKRLLFLPLAGAILFGCKASDRKIELADGVMETMLPTVLSPTGTYGVAATQDGRMLAVLVMVDDEHARLEVRDRETSAVKYTENFGAQEKFMPLIFKDDGTLLMSSQNELTALDLSTGQRAPVGKVTGQTRMPTFDTFRNYDHTIVASQNCVVTCTGKIFSGGVFMGFDSSGRAWTDQGKQFLCIDRNGTSRVGTSRPVGLTREQQLVRGSLKLSVQQHEFKYGGTSAYANAVWLTNGRGRLPDKSALVDVCPDVLTCGFVPGRDEVYVVTMTDTRFIPYRTLPDGVKTGGK